MARTVTLTKTLAAASATAVCASQTEGATLTLLINGSSASGGVATLDTQRRLIITSGGDDSGVIFTIYGTVEGGAAVTEAVAGTNGGVATSLRDFLTVTKIAQSGAIASTVEVGTNTVGSTPWQLVNKQFGPMDLSWQFVPTGTVNVTIEGTNERIMVPIYIYAPPVAPIPDAYPVSGLEALTTASYAAQESSMNAWRMTVNSGTGVAKVSGIQSGIRN